MPEHRQTVIPGEITLTPACSVEIERNLDAHQSARRMRVRQWSMSQQPLISPGRARVLSLSQETQFAPHGIVSRTLLNAPTARVVLFGFARGQELSEHTSTHPALIQILSGECEFRVADERHALKAGDLLYLPPGLPHAVKAKGPFSMLLTLLKSQPLDPQSV